MSDTPQSNQFEQIRAIVVGHADEVRNQLNRIEAKVLAQHDVIRGVFVTSDAAAAGLRAAFERIAADREQKADGNDNGADVRRYYLDELRALIRKVDDGPNLVLIKGGLKDDPPAMT